VQFERKTHQNLSRIGIKGPFPKNQTLAVLSMLKVFNFFRNKKELLLEEKKKKVQILKLYKLG
jgi:hypothetical protein